MARQRFTASDVVGLLECEDYDEPVTQDSDDEDYLYEEGINYNKYK